MPKALSRGVRRRLRKVSYLLVPDIRYCYITNKISLFSTPGWQTPVMQARDSPPVTRRKIASGGNPDLLVASRSAVACLLRLSVGFSAALQLLARAAGVQEERALRERLQEAVTEAGEGARSGRAALSGVSHDQV